MCKIYDIVWQPSLGLLLLFSIVVLLLRLQYGRGAVSGSARPQPRWLMWLFFWGRGVVGLVMLLLMVFGFICAGSPA